MDARLLTKIALRVLAVFMVATGIMGLPQLAMMDMRSDVVVSALLLIAAIMITMPLLIGPILWVLAPRLAGWIVGKGDAVPAAGSVAAADIQAIAFVTLGLIIAIQAGSYVIGVIYVLMTSDIPTSLTNNYVLPAQIAKLILGLALVFGAKGFTRFLRRFREFGLKP